MKVIIKLKGGRGSGNYGHSGRPGKVGGSASKYPKQFADIISKLPKDHLNGVNIIVTDDIPTLEEVKNVRGKFDIHADGSATILLKPGVGEDTLLHEIGHGVMRTSVQTAPNTKFPHPRDLSKALSEEEFSAYIRENGELERTGWYIGLTSYEMSHSSESSAGFYRVYAKARIHDDNQSMENINRFFPTLKKIMDEYVF